jgi:phospholipase/carboxylesterase
MLDTRFARLCSRRQFGLLFGGVAGAVAFGGCRGGADARRVNEPTLTARPRAATSTASAGTRALQIGWTRDGVIRVPEDIRRPLPLVVLLHGASGSGQEFLESLAPAVTASGAVIIAPDSRGRTWDAMEVEAGTVLDLFTSTRRFVGFGPDVAFIDQALEQVFSTIAIDPERIAVAGFSDGATYALSIGVANGDLFRKVVAFSPGFVLDTRKRAQPEIFVSHGQQDRILPIARASRRIVPALKQQRYRVTYREFEGGHYVPADIAREALAWASR